MPGFGGEDSLSPEYAPWAYIGPNNEYFVWQTAEEAKHDTYLYRAGMTDDEKLVCERRPLTEAPLGSLMMRDNVELVLPEDIPAGLFPSLQSMAARIAEVQAQIDEIEPTGIGAAALRAQLDRKRARE